MSDTENGAESNLEVHYGGSSSSQQDSISALPSTFPVEQSSESTDLTSTFAREAPFKDYFDKKLTALKRENVKIQSLYGSLIKRGFD